MTARARWGEPTEQDHVDARVVDALRERDKLVERITIAAERGKEVNERVLAGIALVRKSSAEKHDPMADLVSGMKSR